MRRKPLIIFILTFSMLIAAPLFAGNLKTVTLRVEGMSCRLCEPAVKEALTNLKGVKSAHVSYRDKAAHVEYEEGKVTVEEMIKAVDVLGYKASIPKGD